MKPNRTLILFACLISLSVFPTRSQYTLPESLETGTLREQYDYLNERTRIYNDFRAIREDMFQKIRANSLDSLRAVKNALVKLNGQLNESNARIEALQEEIQETNEKLDEAIRNRDRIFFLGIPMNKVLYNSILWAIIAGLAFLSGILFLANKRLLVTSRRNKRDLEETREEFELHRKQSREKYEQTVVRHHNELKKLKGG
jgi:hypothetical protein